MSCFFPAVFLAGLNLGPDYADDLILKKRSDTAIKFLKPPLSLTVIQNRPKQGSNYFFFGNEKQFHVSNNLDALDSFLSDLKTIKRTLLKTDPTRLVPVQQGADVRGPMTRNVLSDLAKEQRTDLLLIFRWELQVNEKGITASIAGETTRSVALTARGLIYISKQNRVLALPANTQTGTNLRDLTHTGLKILANEARRIIRAQKKIISNSY